jgi:hypothetical protein
MILSELLATASNHRKSGDLIEAERVLKRCYDSAPDNEEVNRNLFELYQQNLASLRASPYMDYPLFVVVETLALCNAKCGFCPYPTMGRLGTKMPDDLIEKIISDLKDVPQDIPFRFSPFKVSDPFVEPRLFSIIEKVNAELPGASIDLYSNGASLTPKKFENLFNIKNFQYLNISLNDHRKDVYENLMKLPFDHTIARLTMIHDRLAAGGVPFSVVVSRVCDYQTDEEFRTWVSERFPLFTVHTHRRSDWLGQVNLTAGQVPEIGCAMWFNVSIMATGVVAYCCMDGEGEYPIGDVRERHVLDVYNDPSFRMMREQRETRIGATPCGQCTFF